MDQDNDLLLVPVQLQAFVLNPAVCNTGEDGDTGARIMPITQPNYTFLRLDNFIVQNDILRHADMHNAAPAETNSRMTDLGARPTPLARRNRHGVYLHWILPQAYRAGITSADSVPEKRRKEERLKRGFEDLPDGKTKPATTPEFLQPPTRWIVVRKLDLDSIEPQDARDSFKEYQAWVIESDYRWALDDIPMDYDLEVDVSPFVVGAPGQDVSIMEQAEVFIGRKTALEDWKPDSQAKYLDITLLRSSNELFADFQLHNSNIFSMLDNFEYGPDGSKLYLNKADASYYLFGWHSSNKTDPLWDDHQRYNRATRLESLFMTLKDSGIPTTTKDWLDSSDSARLCCHGTMYNVKWDHSSKPAAVPADGHANRIQNQEVPVISIGTSPIDALITYCTAHQGKDQDLIKRMEEDILAIDALLHARDDGVEAQREAKDTVYKWNFSQSKGGTHFFLGGDDSDKRPIKPDLDSIEALKELNELQQLLDGCERLVKQRRWDMFSLWWKFVSDVSNKDAADENGAFKDNAEDLRIRIGKMEQNIRQLQGRIDTLLGKGVTKLEGEKRPPLLREAKNGAQPFFYRGRDPTLLIGGIESGWPSDFSDNVTARLPVQTVVPDQIPIPLRDLISDIEKGFPEENCLKASSNLLQEFFGLQPKQNPAKDAPAGHAYPQFHDPIVDGEASRDEWCNRQPWFPLFVEWEVEYFHVPFDIWTLDEGVSRVSDNKHVRYGVDVSDGKPLWEKLPSPSLQDTRILSGRVLILPQPSFSLAAKVEQLFADTPPDILDQYLEKSDRDELLANIGELSFLSCPLMGLTEGLVTLHQGAHIKPENKDMTSQGEISTVVKAAIFENAGLTKENIELISGNSALTPYASSVSFADPEHCPFKPVMHGQMRFRKLNIIDKFGQVIVAIDPKPRVQGPPPLYPCISEFYEPQCIELKDGTKAANTVFQNHGGSCELIQLPPQINQNARLNAEFVMTSAKDGGLSATSDLQPYWRPATEWENPIWGWIVTNFADYGLQLFLADGTFYGEVRITSFGDSAEPPKWSPFAPPENYHPQDTTRLNALIQRLKNISYLKGFWAMLTAAIDSLPPAPSSYAQFLGSVVGKPFALVNMGWSLELDGPPLVNQSTNSKASDPDRQLIHPDENDTEHSYIFQVKLGDKEREYDGLIGYFEGLDKPDETTQEELKYDFVNTYFSPVDQDGKTVFDNLHPISSKNYPKFRPYWVPPFSEEGPPPYDKVVTPKQYSDQRNRHLQIFGAIVDPFTAVHAYSSFLPARELALKPWTWQDAMNNMVAFLHAGPVTMITDVGEYKEDERLTLDKAKQRPARYVGLPVLQSGEWNWLQPYVDVNHPDADVPLYNAFGLDKKGNLLSPGFQNGPYTAVEGFLQLRRPLMAQEPDQN